MTIDTPELIRKPAAMKISGISSAQMYLLMRQNLYPQRIKLGRASAWVRSEVECWVRDRIEERNVALLANRSNQK